MISGLKLRGGRRDLEVLEINDYEIYTGNRDGGTC